MTVYINDKPQVEVFFPIKFHLGMKFYLFHLRMKLMFNPLMLGGNKRWCVTFLLPSGIKGLNRFFETRPGDEILSQLDVNTL